MKGQQYHSFLTVLLGCVLFGTLLGCSKKETSQKTPSNKLVLGDLNSILAPENRSKVLSLTKQLEEKNLTDRISLTHDLLEKSYGKLINLYAFGDKCQQKDNERIEESGFVICRRKMRWGSSSGLEYRIDTTYEKKRIRSRTIKIENKMEAVKILFDELNAIKVIEFMYKGDEVYRIPFKNGLPMSSVEGTEVSKEVYQKFERLLQAKDSTQKDDRAMLFQFEISRVINFLDLLCLRHAYLPACISKQAWMKRSLILNQM